MNFSEKKYANKIALLGHTIIDAVLFLAYVLELLKGSKSLGYVSIFAVLTIAPVLVEWLIFKKDGENWLIMHMIGISYGILYLFVVFTSSSHLPFTYAFPMFFVIILYMDVRFNVLICTFACLGNVIYVAYHAFTVGYTAAEIPDLEIRIAAVLMTSAFMIVTTVAVKKINGYKMEQIERQTKEAKAMMDNILATSQAMINNISEVTTQMTSLGESVTRVHDSMEDVSTGSAETADSVQTQMQRTEQIQEHIGKVKDAATQIEQNISDTVQKVTVGQDQMDALAGQVEKSQTANAEVLAKMDELGTYTGQMNTIIETIASIANSTGMLALNASIEAARAGESGKGFAVVANQISGLASQTQAATSSITSLIKNINIELKHVEEAVDVVTESNNANVESAMVVKSNFEGIAQGTNDIGKRTEELLRIVTDLEKTNGDIVENIQTISAITEEISAHANETFTFCDDNSRMVNSVGQIVNELNEDARKLQNVQ